jgi:hypothetical protein
MRFFNNALIFIGIIEVPRGGIETTDTAIFSHVLGPEGQGRSSRLIPRCRIQLRLTLYRICGQLQHLTSVNSPLNLQPNRRPVTPAF